MKIEVGKKYVNKRGTVIEIYAMNPSALIFHGANDTSHKVHEKDRGILYVNYFSCGTVTPDCPAASDLIREYEEPAKYSVDVWVSKKPAHIEWKSGADFATRLLGNYGLWHLSPGLESCPRHIRITVEEVVE